MIREVCLLSVICAAACSLAPEGTVKTIMGILTSVILMLSILRPVSGFDMDDYANYMAKYREMEYELAADGEELNSRLNRLVIQDEYSAYIKDKADNIGMQISEISFKVEWSTDGFWVPTAVEIGVPEEQTNIELMIDTIESELGIPRERQYWYVVG